jgi:hypothetical protein
MYFAMRTRSSRKYERKRREKRERGKKVVSMGGWREPWR